MNYTLPMPTGLDTFIDRLQKRWYTRAANLWGTTDNTYNCFARAYRNKTKDVEGYIPEFYDPTTKQYVSGLGKNNQGGLFYEDTLAAMSFFGLQDPQRDNQGTTIVKVSWMFFVNLDKITPGGYTPEQAQGQRLDEVCINDVKNFIQTAGCGFRPRETYRNIDKVLELYSGVQKKDSLKNDLHPKFCFRIDMELLYDSALNR